MHWTKAPLQILFREFLALMLCCFHKILLDLGVSSESRFFKHQVCHLLLRDLLLAPKKWRVGICNTRQRRKL
jgi:hypothetical protein